jgi:hypothetical protein
MAEILVKAVSATNPDSTKDQRGCYKRGMPVVVMPDGHPWGLEERLPKFVVLAIPLISVAQVRKYLDQQIEAGAVTRRRLWIIRWSSLPAAAQTILQTTGLLTIKATAAYTGPFDYTWTQVKDYFLNQFTGLNDTAELS